MNVCTECGHLPCTCVGRLFGDIVKKTIEPKNSECMVERCAEQIRKERNLPKSAPVAVGIVCPCPKCSPKLTC